MTTGAIKIMDEYAMANIKERIEIILDNYLDFLEIMNGFEGSFKYLTINGRKMAKRRNRGDLGIRVQTPGFNNSTVNTAVDSVMLMRAVRSGNTDVELKGTECPEQYRKEVKAIREMRNDYFFAKAQIRTLPRQDYKILDSYLNGSYDLARLVEEVDCTYDGAKNRLKRVRNRTRKSAALYLEGKYENN